MYYRPNENGPEILLNLDVDVKMSFSFGEGKLVIPRVIVYDSASKRMLERLLITFVHDEFDVLRVSSSLVYHDENVLPDEDTHLVPFQIDYRWEGVQEDDLGLAIKVMFLVTFLITMVMTYAVCSSKDDVSAKRVVKPANVKRFSQ